METIKSVNYLNTYEEVFKKLQTDSDYLNQISSDPLGALRKAGLPGLDDLPSETGETLKKMISSLVEIQKNTVDGKYQFENVPVNDDYIKFSVNAFGLVWTLSEQATQDAINGSPGLVTALVTLAAASGEVPFISVLAGILAIFIAASSGVLFLIDSAHHKGVYLTVPWTDFIPVFGTGALVIPGPVV